MKDMTAVVDKLKKLTLDKIGGVKVQAVRDYSSLTRILADGTTESIDCAKANAVYYELVGGGFICVRPSGTEPKLKVYYSLKVENEKKAEMIFKRVKKDFESIINGEDKGKAEKEEKPAKKSTCKKKETKSE
jgi:phosphoglucomutase